MKIPLGTCRRLLSIAGESASLRKMPIHTLRLTHTHPSHTQHPPISHTLTHHLTHTHKPVSYAHTHPISQGSQPQSQSYTPHLTCSKHPSHSHTPRLIVTHPHLSHSSHLTVTHLHLTQSHTPVSVTHPSSHMLTHPCEQRSRQEP